MLEDAVVDFFLAAFFFLLGASDSDSEEIATI